MTRIRKLMLVLSLIAGTTLLGFSQESEASKSTDDLSFLVGQWDVVRTYSPNTEKERVLKGTLVCEAALDDRFINCRYEMERPGKIRGVDEVFFNYNTIYERYESFWLSSTWPIKVLMQGSLERQAKELVLHTQAEFLIENQVTEYVKDELRIGADKAKQNTFIRQTHIRTSKMAADEWLHHMTEMVTRQDN